MAFVPEQKKDKGKQVMEVLTDLCDKISIEDEEESGLVVDQGENELAQEKLEWRLAGRFLIDRVINSQAMKDALSKIWRPVKGVFIRDINPNLFLFKFFHELDMERVIKGGPWTFDRHLFLMKPLTTADEPTTVKLNHTELWVQVFDMPIGLQSERVLRDVGNFTGVFVESDPRNLDGNWKTYILIRVALDIRKPVKRKMKI